MSETESTTPTASIEPGPPLSGDGPTPSVPPAGSPARAGAMDKLKAYFLQYFEQTFILLTLVVTALINYHPLITDKLAFLNLYFLPIILSGYYLVRRKAVLGAFFAVLMVTAYVYYEPEAFISTSPEGALYGHIVAW